jgi:hypothetical protein
LGPCGLRDDFLRFPYEQSQTTVICIDEEGMLLDAPWLQIAAVNEGLQGQNYQKFAYLIGIQVFFIKLSRTDLIEVRPAFRIEEVAVLSPCFSSLVHWSRPRLTQPFPERPYRYQLAGEKFLAKYGSVLVVK